LNKSLR